MSICILNKISVLEEKSQNRVESTFDTMPILYLINAEQFFPELHLIEILRYLSVARSPGRLQSRSTAIRGKTRIGPWLEEQERHPEHDEEESEIRGRESPSTTAIDAISTLELSPLVQRAHHQIDHDGRAHGQEAEVQKSVHQGEIRDAGQLLTRHEQVGNPGQDPNERDTEPIAQGRPVHPEHRE